MIVLALLALVVLSVPLLGGRLSRLADLELRALPALWASLVLQVLVIEVLPAALPHALATGGHLASYALAGLFLLRNLDVPGMAVVAVGGGLNAAAIVANGGVMPATARAVRVAGLELGDEFQNSDVSSGSLLWWLGDVFAVPASWPLSNVFSIGDVVLLFGAVALVHGLSGTVLGRLFGVELVEAPPADAGAPDGATVPRDDAGPEAGPLVPRLSLGAPPAQRDPVEDAPAVVPLQVAPSVRAAAPVLAPALDGEQAADLAARLVDQLRPVAVPHG